VSHLSGKVTVKIILQRCLDISDMIIVKAQVTYQIILSVLMSANKCFSVLWPMYLYHVEVGELLTLEKSQTKKIYM